MNKLEKLAQKTILEFAEKYCDTTDIYPIGNDWFGVIGVGDIFTDLSDINFCNNNNIDPKEFFEWYWYSVDAYQTKQKIINLKNWHRGLRPESFSRHWQNDVIHNLIVDTIY